MVLAAAILAWWVLYRPLPQVSGTLAAPVRAAATVTRDGRGVPHIRAASIEDALFLQGFVTAQDRFWQMESMRRAGAGTLAEIAGAGALNLDEEVRRLRLWRVAEDQAARLPERDRAAFAAYVRGVNHYLDTHRSRLPFEFRLLQYDPQPWRVADSVLVGLLLYRDMTNSHEDELDKRNMLSVGDPAKVSVLFSGISGSGVGSNAWVLAGRHTATGKPLLASDPHLSWMMPSTWHRVHLQAPGLDVDGVALPGLPAVVIGHTARIAWGCTNLHFDVQDLYAERLDARTGRYAHQNQVEQARQERERVPVKGEPARLLTQWVTRHGPVLQPQASLALRWTLYEPDAFQYPFLDVARARNWSEFREALRRFVGPGQNFLYADVDGNIGHQVTGRLPIRRTYDGTVPANGVGGQEWDGFIPFDDLPSVFNPVSGRIVSANQSPFPPGYAHPVSGSFATGYRARQIEALLATKQQWRGEELLAVQRDVYGPFEHFLARQVVTAWERQGRDAGLARVTALLREWNGQMEYRLGAPYVARLLWDELRQRLGNSAARGGGAVWVSGTAPAVAEQLLRTRPSGWFPNWDAMLLECLRAAVTTANRQLGQDPRLWRYGAVTEMSLRHPILERVGFRWSFLEVGPPTWFDIGPAPMSGSLYTVKQTSRRIGPSMRFIADLADWDRSLMVITTGVSGHPLSAHYRDQWDAYYTGRGLPMPFRNVDAESTLQVTPQN